MTNVPTKGSSEETPEHGRSAIGGDNTSTEESRLESSSQMEYSQDQIEEAERNLQEIGSDELGDTSSETTGSGSQGSNDGADDEALRTIFIKDIDYDLRESDLAEQMGRLGKIVRVTIPLTYDQARNKGFAYVEFKNVSDAKRALRLDGTELLGRKVMVSLARPKCNQKIFTIFVKNLSYDTPREELKEYFGRFGKVYNVSLPTDPEHSGRNKGFCFVEYNDADIVSKVMKTKHVINGRTLYLNEGNKNEDRNARRSSDRLYGRKNNDSGERRGGNSRYSSNNYEDNRSHRRDDGREDGRGHGRDNRRSPNNRTVFEDSD